MVRIQVFGLITLALASSAYNCPRGERDLDTDGLLDTTVACDQEFQRLLGTTLRNGTVVDQPMLNVGFAKCNGADYDAKQVCDDSLATCYQGVDKTYDQCYDDCRQSCDASSATAEEYYDCKDMCDCGCEQAHDAGISSCSKTSFACSAVLAEPECSCLRAFATSLTRPAPPSSISMSTSSSSSKSASSKSTSTTSSMSSTSSYPSSSFSSFRSSSTTSLTSASSPSYHPSITSSSPNSQQTCDLAYIPGSCGVRPYAQNCLASGKQLDQNFPPSTNGCGAEADDLLNAAVRAGLTAFASRFRSCCNGHDLCWGTCSFGYDTHFDSCNSDFKQCMTDVCDSTATSLLGLGLYPLCLAKAEILYRGVQSTSQGCAAYDSSQSQACYCVPCNYGDGGIGTGPSRIVNSSLVTNVITATCGAATNIDNDWLTFTMALRKSISVARPVDQVALQYYGEVIGYNTTTISSQIMELSQTCTRNRRRSNSRSVDWFTLRAAGIDLADILSSIVNTEPAAYTCGIKADDSTCSTADALIAMARIARTIKSYADDSLSSSASLAPSSASNISAFSSSSSISSSLSTSSFTFEPSSWSTRSSSYASSALSSTLPTSGPMNTRTSVYPSIQEHISSIISEVGSSWTSIQSDPFTSEKKSSLDVSATPDTKSQPISHTVISQASAISLSYTKPSSINSLSSTNLHTSMEIAPVTTTSKTSTPAVNITSISASPAFTSPSSPPSQYLLIHPNGQRNKCLDVAGNKHDNGTRVQIYDCNGTGAQRWLIDKGKTKLRLKGTDFCLDAGLEPQDFTGLKIWKCFDGLFDQDFWYTEDDRIALTDRGLCLDNKDGILDNGGTVQLYRCTDFNTNQVWVTEGA
ncbi:hypothetical protein V866_000603 [Kwoniella sp. B9012]